MVLESVIYFTAVALTFYPLVLSFIPSRRKYIVPGDIYRSVLDDMVRSEVDGSMSFLRFILHTLVVPSAIMIGALYLIATIMPAHS